MSTDLARGERVALTLADGRALAGLITFADGQRIHLARSSPITDEPMPGCVHRIRLADVADVEHL